MSALDDVQLTSVLGHQKALGELLNVPVERRRDIVDKCREAAEKRHPLEHPAVKKVDGEGLYRVRSGDYRAVIDYHLGRVRILRVDHRESVYSTGSLRKAVNRHGQR